MENGKLQAQCSKQGSDPLARQEMFIEIDNFPFSVFHSQIYFDLCDPI